MKIRSLLLGSVAAAGLSTGAFAADLGVLTSLDVCDALGLSGLTISSDTNCLQISGNVSYEFRWGDFRDVTVLGYTPAIGFSDGIVDLFASNHDTTTDKHYDWYSKVEAWLQFVATADSDIGPARAVIKIKEVDQTRYTGVDASYVVDGADDTGGVILDEAYVSIGDSTIIMVGKKGSIANFNDSEPFNFLKTFGYTEVDNGVLFDNDDTPRPLGGHVIQVVSDLGNGVSASIGIENLEGEDGIAAEAGTVVGVLEYKGDGITAHVTGLVGGVLDGIIEAWGVHAGVTGEFDAFKVRAAFGYLNVDNTVYGGDETNSLHALLSAAATFDMFTLALSGEYARSENVTAGSEENGFGVGGSIGATVTDGIAINLGARWFSDSLDNGVDPSFDSDTFQVAAQVVAAITETIKVTGEVGAYFNEDFIDDHMYYGALELAWAPGGGFTSSIKGEVNSEGYRATFKAAKAFN